MSACDVCNKPTAWNEGTAYTAEEFRRLVALGFEPDPVVVKLGVLRGLTSQQAIAAWKQELVARSTTGWLLCPTCAARAARYLPKPVGAGPGGHKLVEPLTPEMLEPVGVAPVSKKNGGGEAGGLRPTAPERAPAVQPSQPAPAAPVKELEMWERKGEGVGPRLGAWLLDQIVILMISFGLGFGIAFTTGLSVDSEAFVDFAMTAYAALIPVVWFLYFTLLEGTFGVTLGKKVRRLRVIRVDGSRCGYGQAALRALLGLFETNLIGALVIGFTERRQRLGDKLAGTLVVSTQKLQRVSFGAESVRVEKVDGSSAEMARLTRGEVLKCLSFNTGLRLESLEPNGRASVTTLRRPTFPSTQKMERLRSELEAHFNLKFSERLDAATAAWVLVGLGSVVALVALLFWAASMAPTSTAPTRRPTSAVSTSAAMAIPTERPAPTRQPTAIPAATATLPQADPARSFAEPVLAQITNRPPDFEDDFSTASGRFVRWSAMSKGWTVADGVFRADVTDGGIDAGGSLVATDFVLRFELMPTVVNGTSWLGVRFRRTGDDYYTLGFDLNNGRWRLSLDSAGKTLKVLDEGTTDTIRLMNWTEVLLVVQGDQMAVFIDDQPVAYVRDNTVAGDWNYIWVDSPKGATEVEIDNLKFWRLDKGPAPTPRPGVGAAPTATPAAQPPATAVPTVQPPAAGEGTATGRILWNDQPFPGVTVKLCTDWSMFGGCKTAEYRAVTDADGRYTISGMPPGEYDFATQLPGQQNETGWIGIKVAIVAGQTAAVRDVAVVKYDLRLSSPGDNETVTTTTPTLAWEAYPGAAYYKVYVSSSDTYQTVVSFEQVSTNQYTFSSPLAPGKYHWSINAYNASRTKIADSGTYYFVVAP
jgi:uncharacterized RDD family membrane protein YckC